MLNFFGDFGEIEFEGTIRVDHRLFNIRVTVEDAGDSNTDFDNDYPLEDEDGFIDHDWGDPADVHDEYDDFPDDE